MRGRGLLGSRPTIRTKRWWCAVGGSDLDVDLDELRAAAARLDRLASTVSVCHPAREDAFGSPVLADAARIFGTRWGHGLADLREDLVQAAARLRLVADAFEQADEDAAARLCVGPR